MSDAETEKRPAFKPGDVVLLRSSDQKMTVERIDGDVVVCAYWWMGALKRESIAAVMLFNQTIRDDWNLAFMQAEMSEREKTQLAKLNGEVSEDRPHERASVIKEARARKYRWMGMFH